MRPIHRVLQRVQVTSIKAMEEAAAVRSWWVFRGQRSWKWRLQPHIERGDWPREKWLQVENESIKKVRAELGTGGPATDDHLGWLAAARHAGHPVRLLDFTRRLDIAVHFATRGTSEDAPSIWMIDGYRVEAAWRNAMTPWNVPITITGPDGNCSEFNRIYAGIETGYSAMLVDPRPASNRQKRQSGLFLTSLDLSLSLEESLFRSMGHEPSKVTPAVGPDGIMTGPVGFTPWDAAPEKAVARLADALIGQLILEIPIPDLRGYSQDRGVTDRTLGLDIQSIT